MTAYRLQNYLLRTMSDADFALIGGALTLVDLAKGEELALPETRIKNVWFPLSGITSVVAATESGIQAEVGIVGREGMISVATLHGVEFEMMHIFVQMAGQALRMPAATLRTLLVANPSLYPNTCSATPRISCCRWLARRWPMRRRRSRRGSRVGC